jgi:hypothetical protein
LICFQRYADEAVPGCSGPSLSTEDYCIKPADGTLIIMGDGDLPAENFPLGECEGDCDGDGDCAVRQLLSSSYRVIIEASRISHFWAWLKCC